MALKTFNVDKRIYDTYSKHCKKNGISMSKQVEKFLQNEIEKLKISVGKVEMMEKMDSKQIARAQKIAKEIEKEMEHPLQKYC